MSKEYLSWRKLNSRSIMKSTKVANQDLIPTFQDMVELSTAGNIDWTMFNKNYGSKYRSYDFVIDDDLVACSPGATISSSSPTITLNINELLTQK